jgi:hypothetical protein
MTNVFWGGFLVKLKKGKKITKISKKKISKKKKKKTHPQKHKTQSQFFLLKKQRVRSHMVGLVRLLLTESEMIAIPAEIRNCSCKKTLPKRLSH